YGGSGNKTNETFIDVWYDDASVVNVSGALPAGTTTWTAASGPYVVTANVNVPAGSTLVIQPGTTVFFNIGTNLTVDTGGTIIAEGNEHNRIHFTRTPGTNTTNWGGFHILSTNDNRFAWFNEEYVGGGSARGARIDGGYARFDHGMWRNMTVSIMDGNSAAYRVTNSF